MAQTDEERPPYVIFEMRDVEDRAATLIAGHYVGREVAYASITRPGSKDTYDQEAEVWLNSLAVKAKQGLIPQSWHSHFVGSYKSWKDGETTENIKGTPIKGWTGLGPAAQKTLIAAGILSVEDLAAMPDADLMNVGTGAVGFKLKARNYLEAVNGPGKMAEQMTALQIKMGELVDLTRQQAQEITALRAKLPQDKK